MKNIKFIIIGIVGLVMVAGAFLFMRNVAPKMNAAMEIANAMQPILEAENKSMHVKLDAGLGEQTLQLDADVYAVVDENVDFLIIKQGDGVFYIAEDLLFVENGKAFLISEEDEGDSQAQDDTEYNLADMLPLIATIYEEFEVVRTETDEETVLYQATVTGEQVQKLLNAAMMTQADMAAGIEAMEVSLTTKSGSLEKICLSGAANTESGAVNVAVAVNEFAVLSDDTEIPQEIIDSLETVDKSKLFCLTEDLYRLVKALAPLSDMESMEGSVTLYANCSVLRLDTTMDLEQLQALAAGRGDTTGQGDSEVQNPEEIQALPELIGTMLMEGDISCTKRGGSYVYALVLDEAAMTQLAGTIMPELLRYVVNYEEGTIKLVITEDMLDSMSVEIEGSLKVLFTKVPVSVGAKFIFER